MAGTWQLIAQAAAGVANAATGRVRLFINDSNRIAHKDDAGNVITYASTVEVDANTADGDKGDITVASTGTVWTINDGSVTLAKLDDIDTAHFLGRVTASTGAVESLTTTQVRAAINVEDGADATDETNVLAALDGATIPSITATTSDKVLLQDADDTDAMGYATVNDLLGLFTLADDSVTFAKMQDSTAAERIVGRGEGSGAGTLEELSLGTGLSMTGTTINGVAAQDLYETVAGDTGSTAADTTTDTLTIAGGTGITTAMSGKTLTVTNDDGGAAAAATHESTYDHDAYDTHTADTANPHSVTAAQAGADPTGTAASAVSAHEADGDAHTQYLKIAAVQTIVTEATATHDLDNANQFAYHRFTSTSAKTLTVRANATHAIDTGASFDIRNVGAEDLTISPAGGVTVNAPAEGTLVVPTGGTVVLKNVTTDEFDLIGHTVPA